MKKRIISLAVFAVFVLAVFSGCAAMRRYRADELGGINALNNTTNGNYLSRNANENRYNAADTTSRPGEPNAYGVPVPDADGDVMRRPLTVDHLSSLVGMTEADINMAFGSNYRAQANGGMGRTYNHMMYGNATDIDVMFGRGGEKIDQIVVTASRGDAERWQRELDARYGSQRMSGTSTSEWLAAGTRITMQPVGENVRIVFSNTL